VTGDKKPPTWANMLGIVDDDWRLGDPTQDPRDVAEHGLTEARDDSDPGPDDELRPGDARCPDCGKAIHGGANWRIMAEHVGARHEHR
jgi:hypothetical protein